MKPVIEVKIEGDKEIIKSWEEIRDKVDVKIAIIKTAERLIPRLKERFMEGKNAKGGKIRDYSDKPMYVSGFVPGFAKIKRSPIGKTRKSKFASGKKHRSRYFEGGWGEVREYFGRRRRADRFVFTGRLMRALKSKSIKDGAKVHFNTPYANKIAPGLEKRFEFWGLTKEERAFIGKEVNNEIHRMIGECVQ